MSLVAEYRALRRLARDDETPSDATYSHPSGKIVRQIGLADGCLVEIVASPDWPDFAQAAAMIRARTPFERWRVGLFKEIGRICIEQPTPAPPPVLVPTHDAEDRIVCPCSNLSLARLMRLFEQGMSVDEVIQTTNATKTCGGCRVEIAELGGVSTLRPARLVARESLDAYHVRLVFEAETPRAESPNPAAWIALEADIDGRKVRRNYTLVASEPERGRYTIIVRREENGLLSQWLHDHAVLGPSFRISTAQGGFTVENEDRLLFIAGGVGITPALSLLHHLVGRNGPRVHLIWSIRTDTDSRLVYDVRELVAATPGATLDLWDSRIKGRLDRGALAEAATDVRGATAHLCGPLMFMDAMEDALGALGWSAGRIRRENFYPDQLTARPLDRLDAFDYERDTVRAERFKLTPVASIRDEAEAFLKQFYYEQGAACTFETRMRTVHESIDATGTYKQTFEELAYGARIAWRNNTRCIGRFFWRTLTVIDRRDARTEREVFDCIVEHIRTGTNQGDLVPAITIFEALDEPIHIVNPQLLLYAGYRQADGHIVGDPKNVELTEYAQSLGWEGPGGRFDILPIIIQIGSRKPKVFKVPASCILEVPISHPEHAAIDDLGLRWFALPAVSGMALDVGGIQYTAAPSNGFYMATEIGSFNLAQTDRYNLLPDVATALGLSISKENPMWRDQAVVEINRAVLHSFRAQGVRILDHHTLADYFERFRADEQEGGRAVYGHWPWIVPPLSSNLTPVWHNKKLRNQILKPNYFYKDAPRWSAPEQHADRAGWHPASNPAGFQR